MTDWEAWHAEERFWNGGENHCRQALNPACVMAFPAPVWRRHRAELGGRAALVFSRHGGKARGLRDGAAPYEACCTSTYRDAGDRWRLVQHQQTPA